jgi:hypothetical protein
MSLILHVSAVTRYNLSPSSTTVCVKILFKVEVWDSLMKKIRKHILSIAKVKMA